MTSCNFDFSNYPLDDQNCNFRMVLYDVNVTFYDHLFMDYGFPALKEIEMQGFKITKTLVGSVYIDLDSFIPYSAFGIEFKIKRIIKPYLMQYYIPCFTIVVVSFLSFVVPISAIPGRVGLVVTQFLTLTTIFIHQKVFIYLQ